MISTDLARLKSYMHTGCNFMNTLFICTRFTHSNNSLHIQAHDLSICFPLT